MTARCFSKSATQNFKPEKNNGIDLSLRHQNSRVKAEANFYYYAFKNFVFLAPTNTFDPDSGFEFAGSCRVTADLRAPS